MQLKKLIFVLLVTICLQVSAQKLELGKVSVKELEQNSYPKDTAAPAAILFKKGRSYFRYEEKIGFSLVHEYQFRIKIYKKEGLRWADHKVRYYVGYETLNKDQLAFSNAVTYNLENGQIVKTKLNGEGKFKNNVNEFWNEKSISMPNVKPGSVIEFSYILKSEDIVQFPQFEFQYEIPLAYAEYTTEIPEFFRYKSTKIGFGTMQSDAKVVNGYQSFQNEHHQTVNVSFQQINSSYKAENVPALREEPYVDNLDNYKLSVAHELEKTVFPDAPEKNYATTWEGVASTIYKDKRFGDELKQRSYFEPFLEPVLKNATTPTEKATAVFDFVKNTMSWNGFYGYYSRDGVKKAFADRTGNVAEVNFILIAMLNYSGVRAYPVLLSTVNHGVPVFPNRTVFNYVIAAIDLDGKQILLDATDKNSGFHILPARDLNWTGRLIKPDGSSTEINLVPETPSKKMVNLMAKIESSGKISGKVRIQRTDYDAYTFREKYGKQNRQQYLEKLEEDYNGIQISDYTADNNADAAKPVSESFTFTTEKAIDFIDGKIYLDPLLFFTMKSNPFVLEERQFPVYYGYPFQVKYNVNYEIPEGYAIESMPKSIKVTTGENLGNFAFNIQNVENKIQIMASFEINSAIVSGNFYEAIKAFYKNMIDKQNEKIILKKI